jgi:uncharacterized protein YjeT (DUF2065 family)
MNLLPAGPSVATDGRLPRSAGERLLRLVLKLDAVVTGANGLAYLVAAGALEDLLGLPTAPLRGVGGFLLVFGVVVWLAATRPVVAHPAVGAVIAANLAWAAGSVLVAVLGAWSPTTAGTVWILLQAAVVAALAGLQRYALGRIGR